MAQTLADIFAVGSEISAPDGTKYRLRPLTLIEQSEFQRWLEQRAHDAVDRSPAPEPAKDRRHAIIDREAALGYYEYEGPYSIEAVATPAGLAKVVELCCRDQGITGEQAEKVVAHSALEVARHVLQVAGRDPKVIRSVLQALGLPTDWLQSEGSETSSEPSSTPRSPEPSPNSVDSPTTNSSSSTQSTTEAPMG